MGHRTILHGWRVSKPTSRRRSDSAPRSARLFPSRQIATRLLEAGPDRGETWDGFPLSTRVSEAIEPPEFGRRCQSIGSATVETLGTPGNKKAGNCSIQARARAALLRAARFANLPNSVTAKSLGEVGEFGRCPSCNFRAFAHKSKAPGHATASARGGPCLYCVFLCVGGPAWLRSCTSATCRMTRRTAICSACSRSMGKSIRRRWSGTEKPAGREDSVLSRCPTTRRPRRPLMP